MRNQESRKPEKNKTGDKLGNQEGEIELGKQEKE
jgi:hypothetical protein